MTYHLDTAQQNEPLIKKILSATFPGYKGRSVKISTAKTFIPDQSWSGGSRTTWRIISREGKLFDPGKMFSGGITNPQAAFHPVEIPPNCFCIQHSYFCGKDSGITILVRPDEMDTGLLPQTNHELTREEKIVLIATRSFKSSYAGKSNYRFYEANQDTGIDIDRWNKAVSSLIDKGLLAKNKAITPAGRNASADFSMHSLRNL